MRITKKDQIIELHKKGFGIEDIIKKGFTKKYINQVLKNLKDSDSVDSSNNKTTIGHIKELLSILEDLQNKSDKINININISIKVDTCSNTTSNNKAPLLNPVAIFRDIGKDGLKEQLMLLQLEDLLKIIKTYTPDLNGKIYKQKNLNIIIEYIVERASNLSKVGQVFRTVSKCK